MMKNEVAAPKVNREELWKLSVEEFNEWRRTHDFPRIIATLKDEFSCFEVWMLDQNISDALLLEFGIVDFLRPIESVFVYAFRDDRGEFEREVRQENLALGEITFQNKTVTSKQQVIPFLKWIEGKSSKVKITEQLLCSHGRSGRKSYIFNRLELLDLGDISLGPNFELGNRFLDFLNLDDLEIKDSMRSARTRLWYSTAVNLCIRGDFAFFNAHCSTFLDVSNMRSRSLRVVDGRFQDFCFTQCDLNIRATNATLNFWEVEGTSFYYFVDHTELRLCKFTEGKIRYPVDYKRAAEFHASVKRLYSQVGQYSQAGQHLYKEKSFERKSLLRPSIHFRHPQLSKKHAVPKYLLYPYGYLKSFALLVNQLVWGFGEKPSRTFICATAVIFLAAGIFFFNSSSATTDSFSNSLYYSIVTYTTLGYGEIVQTDIFLKYLSSIEALIGLLLTGLMIAGFAAKSKDYS